jgi:hypothetical protein
MENKNEKNLNKDHEKNKLDLQISKIEYEQSEK